MAIYPLIATLKVETKKMSFEVNLRAKYIELERYVCKIHGEAGYKDVLHSFSCNEKSFKKEKDIHIQSIIVRESKKSRESMQLPRELFKGRDYICCPYCYLREKKKVKMKIKMVGLIKVYCSNFPLFTNPEHILRFCLPVKWNRSSFCFSEFSNSYACFFDTVGDVRGTLRWFQKIHLEEEQKGYSASLKIFPFTLKEMKKEWEEYNMRKLWEAI